MEEVARGIAWIASAAVLGGMALLAAVAFRGGEHAGKHRVASSERDAEEPEA